jgi:hypothetical protein
MTIFAKFSNIFARKMFHYSELAHKALHTVYRLPNVSTDNLWLTVAIQGLTPAQQAAVKRVLAGGYSLQNIFLAALTALGSIIACFMWEWPPRKQGSTWIYRASKLGEPYLNQQEMKGIRR